jgi:hypothetical protein
MLVGHALHVYAFDDASRHEDLVRRCVNLGMARVRDRPVWRDGSAPGTVEAIAVPGAMMVCRTGAGWSALRAAWCAESPRPGEVLGDVLLLYARYRGVRRSWRTVAPAVEAELGSPATLLTTSPVPGCYLVERVPADTGGVRTFVLVGPASQGDRMDRWVWPAGVGRVQPVPDFLWQANRLRHEQRLFERYRQRVRDRQASVSAHVAAILADRPPDGLDPASADELRHLQWETAKTAADEARLRAQAVTVDAIVSNMSDALAGWPTDEGGPVAADLELGRWLAAEIRDEADGAQHSVALAEPITRAALADNDLKYQRLGERTERLITVQAAAIGAVVLVFATSQSISYRWPAAESLKLPFIVVVGLLALAAPIWAGLRPTRDSPQRRTPRWLPAVVAALAAATAWLLATLVSGIVADHPAPTIVSSTTAVVAAIGTVVAARLRRRRRPNRT